MSSAKKTPKSKRISFVGALEKVVTPVLTEINDDDAERRQRQLNTVLELNIRHESPSTPADRRRSVGAGIGGLSNVQLAEHYTNCMKLSAENKITTKNAFSLHLIDYMATMLKAKEGKTNFQVASCTLDASTKIYACRVDCVHTEVFKMAGGLISDDKNKKQPDKEAEAGEPEDGEEGKVEQKKKRKVKKSATIEQNLKNITLNKLDMECLMDPLFQKLSAEESGTSNLLLSYLNSQDDSGRLRFDPDYRPFAEHDTTEYSSKHIDLEGFSDIFSKVSKQESEICPTFRTFSFLHWEKSPNMSDDSFLPDEPQDPTRLDLVFDIDANVEPIDEDEVDDVGPLPDLYDEDAGEDFGRDANLPLRTPLRKSTLQEMTIFLADKPTDYSYFNNKLLCAWAGPKHWRLKPISKLKNANEDQEKRKRKEKPVMRINFDGDVNLDLFVRVAKKSIRLARGTMTAWNEEKTTNPEDLHYALENLFSLSLDVKKKLCKAAEPEDLDKEVGNYNYDNANDSQNFCPSQACDEDDDDDYDVPADDAGDGYVTVNQDQSIFTQPSTIDPGGQAPFEGENLVQQPYKVEKINIGYARTAKKIDVKQLKQAMWKILTTDENKENIVAPENPKEVEKVEGQTTFTSLYTQLPNELTPLNAKNLSVPIAFVAFLHMANEKTLKLEGKEDLSDFAIMQG